MCVLGGGACPTRDPRKQYPFNTGEMKKGVFSVMQYLLPKVSL